MNLRPFRGIVPTLGARAYVDPAACVIGDVHLGEDSSIWPGCVVRGDVNHIRIGARTNVQDGSIVHVTHEGPFTRPGNGRHGPGGSCLIPASPPGCLRTLQVRGRLRHRCRRRQLREQVATYSTLRPGRQEPADLDREYSSPGVGGLRPDRNAGS